MRNSIRLSGPLLVGAFILTLVMVSLTFTSTSAAPVGPTPQPGDSSKSICDPTRTVQVNGAATINVAPDRAMIQLGVQSNGSTPASVQADNAATIQKVIAAIQAQGIESKDITTDRYMVEPVYESYDSLYIKGYRIHNMIAVTVKDTKKTSDLIVAALEAGANQILSVEFYTSKLREYRDQAREMAVTAAREKAQALANAAGAEAGCVVSIHENTWTSYNGWWFGRNQNLWTQNAVQNVAPAEATSMANDEPISLGQIAVKAEVNATFGLR